MARSSGKRLWRCRAFAILILVLTCLALLITWKQLPDEGNFNNGLQSAGKQWLTARGNNYFDIRRPVEKVSVQQVTLVHAERSYPEENGTALDDSRNTSSSLSPSSLAASKSIFPTVPRAVSSPHLAKPTKPSSATKELADRKALIESSKKV